MAIAATTTPRCTHRGGSQAVCWASTDVVLARPRLATTIRCRNRPIKLDSFDPHHLRKFLQPAWVDVTGDHVDATQDLLNTKAVSRELINDRSLRSPALQQHIHADS